MSKRELIEHEFKELTQTLRHPAKLAISKKISELICEIHEEENFSQMSIILGLWGYLNLLLRKLNHNSPDSELQKLMNHINIEQSKFLDEKEALKDE